MLYPITDLIERVAVMSMRAYAFTGRSNSSLFVLCPSYATLVGINIWVFCTDIPALPDELFSILGLGCYPDYGSEIRFGVRCRP